MLQTLSCELKRVLVVILQDKRGATSGVPKMGHQKLLVSPRMSTPAGATRAVPGLTVPVISCS